MKFSRYLRLTMASVVMLGAAAVANATTCIANDCKLGTTPLPAALGNQAPYNVGPSYAEVTVGDVIGFKGDWSGLGTTDYPGTKTSWYFTTLLPNLILSNASIAQNGFNSVTFLAQLFLDGNPTPVYTFIPNNFTPPLIYLVTAGLYRIDVTADLKHGDGHSYTFNAQVVPLPAAAWLLLSGVAGLGALARRRKVVAEA